MVRFFMFRSPLKFEPLNKSLLPRTYTTCGKSANAGGKSRRWPALTLKQQLAGPISRYLSAILFFPGSRTQTVRDVKDSLWRSRARCARSFGLGARGFHDAAPARIIVADVARELLGAGGRRGVPPLLPQPARRRRGAPPPLPP